MNEFTVESPHDLEVGLLTDFSPKVNGHNAKQRSQSFQVGKHREDSRTHSPFELDEKPEMLEQDDDVEDEINFYKPLNDIKSDQPTTSLNPNIHEPTQINSASMQFPPNLEQYGSSFTNVDIGIQDQHATDRFPVDEIHSFYTHSTDHNAITSNTRYGACELDSQLCAESWGDIFVDDSGADDSCRRVSGNQMNSNFIDLMRCEPHIPTRVGCKDESDITNVIENLDQAYHTRNVFQDNGTAGRWLIILRR